MGIEKNRIEARNFINAKTTKLLGVKEVPVESLIPNKKYFYFSHMLLLKWFYVIVVLVLCSNYNFNTFE